MFSGLVRWFHQHVEPEVPESVIDFLTPLAHDVATAGATVFQDVVQTAVGQAAALANGGSMDFGKILQAGIDAGKGYLVQRGLPDLEHAAVGVAAAAVANLHATIDPAAELTPPVPVVIPPTASD